MELVSYLASQLISQSTVLETLKSAKLVEIFLDVYRIQNILYRLQRVGVPVLGHKYSLYTHTVILSLTYKDSHFEVPKFHTNCLTLKLIQRIRPSPCPSATFCEALLSKRRECFQLSIHVPSWSITPYRLSATACSIYYKLLTISGGPKPEEVSYLHEKNSYCNMG